MLNKFSFSLQKLQTIVFVIPYTEVTIANTLIAFRFSQIMLLFVQLMVHAEHQIRVLAKMVSVDFNAS